MRILAICPIKFDGTSYYRAYGIFPHLKKLFLAEGDTFDVVPYNDYGGGYTWADLLPYDILFLQRPSMDAKKRIELIAFCKQMGKKIWVDFDDNLFQTPPENRVHSDMTKEVMDAMLVVLSMADLITVSTPGLKAVYEAIGLKNKIEVVPNAWNFGLHGFAEGYNFQKPVPPPQKPKTKIMWRGSETHQGDLWDAGGAIVEAAGELHDKAVFTFFGYNPWMITEVMQRESWNFLISEDIMRYFMKLKQEAPQMMFFPLRNNPFNHCKSNIAWMEATYAGSVCVAPNWPEWQKPGVINYNDDAELKQYMVAAAHPDVQKEMEQKWQQSAAYIREHLSLDKINQQRKELLTTLIS